MDGVTPQERAELLEWLDTEAKAAANRQARESDPVTRAFHEGTMRAYLNLYAKHLPKAVEEAITAGRRDAADHVRALYEAGHMQERLKPGLDAALGELDDLAAGRA